MTFRELAAGQSFDFIDDSRVGFNSFFRRCVKTGFRQYKDDAGNVYTVGSILAPVFHIA